MRAMLLLSLSIIVIAAPLAAEAGYGEMFEKVDIDKIIGDEALFNEYIDCCLDKGPCSTELLIEFKKIVPEIIATACEKCSTPEKGKIRKLVNTIYEKKPNKAIEFHKKYDPTGEYEPKFAAFLMARDD